MNTVLRNEWAKRYDLKESKRRFIFCRGRYLVELVLPPGCDHTTLWYPKGGKPGKIMLTPVSADGASAPAIAEEDVLVTQPYPGRWKQEFARAKDFAVSHGFWFFVSEAPGWHYPDHVLHVEWTRRNSRFGQLRNAAEAHAWHGTIDSYTD